MRNLTTLIISFVFTFSAFSGISQEFQTRKWIKNGTKLTYQVNYYGAKYKIVISKLLLSDTSVSFDYEMVEGAAKMGFVEMNKIALDSAIVINTSFAGGALKLKTKTAFWVSKRVYKALDKKYQIMIDAGPGNEYINAKSKDSIEVLLNDKNTKVFLPIIYAETSNGNKFWILDDPKRPIIVKMDIGWQMNLMLIEENAN
jgi:hypothetical protein